MPTVVRKLFTEESEEELTTMPRSELIEQLTDREIKFCEQYIKSSNIKISAVKAGYKPSSAHISGWKVRQKPLVNRYIAWLKLKISKSCHVDAMDIIDTYVRIAFADITDFVTIEHNRIRIVDGEKVDGQLVKSIRNGKDGLQIELYDKLSALDKLERYFDVMPQDWKQKIEEKKLDLMREKLDMEKLKAGLYIEDGEDDGFLEAIKASAKEVWDEED